MTLTLVSFVGCYSAFELEVETVKGEMVTRLSNRAPISLLNGSSATAIGYSGMADIEVKVQGQGVALGDHRFDLDVSTGPVLD